MATIITILSILLCAAIIIVVLAVLYSIHLTKDQQIYLDSVTMYERIISSCPTCKYKVDKNWKKLKEYHANRR